MGEDAFRWWIKRGLKPAVAKRLLRLRPSYAAARLLIGGSRAWELESWRLLMRFAVDQAARAFLQPRRTAWTTAFFPTELVYATGCVPFSPEVASAVAASLGVAPGLLDRSDSEWYSSDLCSFHRVAAGAAAEGFLPVPAVFLASSHICDGGPFLFRNLSLSAGIPCYTVDVPPGASENDGEAIEYVAGQLREAGQLLEESTRRRLTAEALSKAIKLSNDCRRLMLEVGELRRRAPSPLTGCRAFTLLYLMFTGLGSEESTRIYRQLRDDLESLPAPAAPGGRSLRGERRVVWLHMRPFFPTALLERLEKDLGTVVACEELNEVYWEELDLERPYEALARKMLSHPGYGAVERRIRFALKMVDKYSADGVICFANWGCRQGTGSAYMVREALREEGIPCLVLDGDCLDQRNFSEGQAMTRLEAFVETIGGRPA